MRVTSRRPKKSTPCSHQVEPEWSDLHESPFERHIKRGKSIDIKKLLGPPESSADGGLEHTDAKLQRVNDLDVCMPRKVFDEAKQVSGPNYRRRAKLFGRTRSLRAW
jgi:hypothetical protein